MDMIDVVRHVHAPAAQVWRVLADGWTYASWVVGASRVRAVDPRWPQAGTRLHHSVGVWPAVLSDSTKVEISEPQRRLVLLAQGRPFGTARVEVLLTPEGDGTQVRMIEDAVDGVARAVPLPVRQVVLGVRNRETLRRLAYLAEARPSPDSGEGPAAGSPASRNASTLHDR
jgi:carbon monoxide dehydrogenase subunit G